MALSSMEKAKLRLYLGYPNQFRYKNTRLESTFDSIDDDAEVLVRDLLGRFDDLDELIDASSADATGTLKQVDEIQFYPNANAGKSGGIVGIQLAQAKRLVTRLSTILGVPIYADIFSAEGYPGDRFSELGGLGGGKNIVPLG
jgi:hypothetical protein